MSRRTAPRATSPKRIPRSGTARHGRDRSTHSAPVPPSDPRTRRAFGPPEDKEHGLETRDERSEERGMAATSVMASADRKGRWQQHEDASNGSTTVRQNSDCTTVHRNLAEATLLAMSHFEQEMPTTTLLQSLLPTLGEASPDPQKQLRGDGSKRVNPIRNGRGRHWEGTQRPRYLPPRW